MVQRFLRDESGITMGLTVMMILLISVMGAGLLTFVSRDLNTVIETNRGQMAFEVADAGIAAAERQLESDCIENEVVSNCRTAYDSDGLGDSQWDVAEGGVTLRDLDGDGNLTTIDSVTVTIDLIEVEGELNPFRVISTGTYGGSKRKIEAIFEPIAGGGGGGNVINPAYYTPSDIRLRSDLTGHRPKGVDVKGMNFFTEGNIIIEGMLPYKTSCEGGEAEVIPSPPPDSELNCFATDYEFDNGRNDAGRLTTTNGRRVLADWNSKENLVPSGNWNTVGRLDRRDDYFDGIGFGAVGMICGGIPTTDPNAPTDLAACDNPLDSIADGRFGYDRTTGLLGPDGTPNPQPRGQELTFVDKAPINDTCGTGPLCYDDNVEGTITFPFPREEPDAARLKQLAINTGGYHRPPISDWDSILTNKRRVVFIDAENQELTFDATGDNGAKAGIIVVWCGTLKMTNVNSFQGIIMSLNGSGEGLPPDPETGQPSTNCEGDPLQGRFTVADSNLGAWFYAEGGDGIYPGIDLGPGTSVGFFPSGDWRLLDLIFEDAIPTSFDLQGWRECYQIVDPTQCNT